MSEYRGAAVSRPYATRPRLLAAAAAALALVVATGALITHGFGAWGVTTTNAPSTVVSDLIIVPVVTSTHPSHTAGTVNLSWTEPTTWVQGYNILRATTPAGTYGQIGSVSGAANTTYSDTTAAYNTQYYYEVAPYYFLWNPASAVDMALSMPPTSGTDSTGAAVTFTSTNLTAMSTVDASGYTTAHNWATTASFGGTQMEGLYFVDGSDGWAVGQAGAIYASTDGGGTWTAQTSGSASKLHGVWFMDTSNGWVLGDTGTILHTTNGGTTWTPQVSGTTNHLWRVFMLDANNGWVVGDAGTILHTTNGGTTWSAQTSGTANKLHGEPDFLDASNGWVAGDGGTILHTTNGGTSWSTQTSGTTNNLKWTAFVDLNNGWVVGDSGTIRHTSNGGGTWSAQTSGTAGNLAAADFVDLSNGWAVGASGTIIHTSNGGGTWSAQTSGTTNSLLAVGFFSASSGIAVGQAGDAVITSDGGTTWIEASPQRLEFAPSPVVASGAPVTSVFVTMTVKASSSPSAATQTVLAVSPDSGATWTYYVVTNPTTAYTTQSVNVTSVFPTAAAVSQMRMRFFENGSNSFTTTHDLVHVDVN